MTLVVVIDVVVVALLVGTVITKGFEQALPLTACLFILFPTESQIELPGLFGMTTQRIIVIALVALYFVKGEGGRKAQLPLKYLIILVTLWMLISSANSVVPVVSFKSTLSRVLDFFVPYYIYARTVSKTETIHKIMFGFVAGMFVCSVFGFFEAYYGWSVLSVFPSLPSRFSYLGNGADRGIRIQSTFGHAILFGAALAMVIPMALYLLTVVNTKVRKAFLWSAIMLMVLCIYKTGSRGPWLALALSLGLLLVLGRGHVRKYLAVIAMLTITVLLMRPGVWQTIADLYGETVNPDTIQGQSYQWRYLLFDLAKRQLSKDAGRSLWGYGPESFYYLGLTAPFFVDGEEHTVKVESCDSAVVELMMDTGYVGFFIVALMLVKAGCISLRNYFRLPRAAGPLCLIFFVNICAFSFLMTNVELFGWGQQSYLLWIVIALTMLYSRFQSEGRALQEHAPPGLQLLEATAV